MAKIAGKNSYPNISDELRQAIKETKVAPIDNAEEEVSEKPIKKQSKLTPTKGKMGSEEFSEMEERFGSGFSGKEYEEMNDKFLTLQNNYPLKTKMHEEALVTYVKYAFKRDKAIANDDIEAAEKWGKLAAKQATDAKINPSQLSAADLSDGMTCFSQVSATVERAQDIIPLLNKFIDKPQDRVDYTIWQYVNYCRHLEGKPLCQYKDLYKFLKKRYEEYKMDYSFLFDEGDGKFDTNDLGD